MGSLFGEAAAGAVFQEVIEGILAIVKRSLNCDRTLQDYSSTLQNVRPKVDDMVRRARELDRSTAEVEKLASLMQDGEEFVRRCSDKSLWNSICSPYHQMELIAGDESLRRILSCGVQAQMAIDVMEILKGMREVLMILYEQFGTTNYGSGTALYGTSEEPDFVVGLDQLLNQLKFDLLNGSELFLNLTGFGGSGKTTLANKLCFDPQVQGKFKKNIFFATFTETPQLKIIVGELFRHFGQPKPEFQSNEDPGYKLRNLLKKIGESPILLVLDDVYRESKGLVEKFEVPISNLKILVTSRVKLSLKNCITRRLEKLSDEDSMTLFRYHAQINDTCLQNDLAEQIVKCCGGFPLILKIIGSRLREEEVFESWQIMERELSQNGGSLVDSDDEVLAVLQKCFDVLDLKPIVKKFFMDLGLFPEDQMIPISPLVDMWTELHEHDLPEEFYAMKYINELTSMNLSTLVVTRKVASEADNYYNNHFLKQHDLLRDLAIRQCNRKPLEQRDNLIIDIDKNNHPELWSEPKEQGIISDISHQLSIVEKQKQVTARSVSISSGEAFTLKWWSMKPDRAEVLVLNIGSNDYALPGFIKYMKELKVLILINYSFHPSQIHSFELLGSLPNLKKIRLQKVSVPSLSKLKKLKKLSLHVCTIGPAFENCPMDISDALPDLVELNIDYCKDLAKLPAEICKIGPLKKLSITNCHKFSELPKEIGNLQNLEVLRLCSCSELKEIPDSIKRLQKLNLVDISYCTSLKQLPEDFGDLCNLKKLYMKGCSRCELPDSVKNLQRLEVVICDEETAASWETFRPQLPNLSIQQHNAEINLNWLGRL